MSASRPAAGSGVRRLISATVLTLLLVAAVVLALSNAHDLLVVALSLAAALALVDLAGTIDSSRPITPAPDDRTAV
ncbi:hypothetical protein Kfla_1247 [Kribbella flavida DSM 17836]|uniref:Uncharacterized protein n=1 Tax=Kribbella flavida (strain DSM 17836 / JCM 10339 / NBRC 14399) TaxID=479435 RepID=D2Q436_KRIFD|nr:hypothetical protein [Kribbella flavida]ADB30350.1 hypothetical protein Kfla_1247 [Kribbella flavida DSM 17836]